MPYKRLPRPGAYPKGQLLNVSSVPDEGHFGTDGSALASRLLRSGTMGAMAPLATAARPLIALSAVASGLPALRTTASAHGARLISGGTIGAASTSTVTTSFLAPTITIGLLSATTTATPAMPTTAMAAGSEHLAPASVTSEREHMGWHQLLGHPNEPTM
ncbi:unnamed protein product [Ascophyllum nodosum]